MNFSDFHAGIANGSSLDPNLLIVKASLSHVFSVVKHRLAPLMYSKNAYKLNITGYGTPSPHIHVERITEIFKHGTKFDADSTQTPERL